MAMEWAPGWLSIPAFPMPAARIHSFALLLPWYQETGFLILASLAIFVIAFLSRIAWRHHRQAAFLRRHDLLTGLANSTVFEASFQHAISFARADNTHVAMMLLDLDRFKPI